MLFTLCSNKWEYVSTMMGAFPTSLRLDQVEIRARHLPEIRALSQDETDHLWMQIDMLERHALKAMSEQLNSE